MSDYIELHVCEQPQIELEVKEQIVIGGGGIIPTGTKTINVNSNGTTTEDVTTYASAQIVANVPNSYSAGDEGKVVENGALVSQGSAEYTSNGTYDTTKISSVEVSVSGSSPSGTKEISISQNGTTTEDVAAYASAEISVSVPTGPAKTSDDLTVSGPTVTVPAGLYSSAASKSVASGTAGTPSATKGAVSNHSIEVTPSVTNSAGYIASETKTGTPVTVQASELVNGSETKTQNGTYDVTNLAELVVNVSGGGGVSVDDIAKNSAPSGAVVLGSGVTAIEAYAFRNKPLTSVESQYVTNIKAGAFQGCSSLESAEFPNTTNLTGADIFRDCSSLEEIHFPKLTTMGSSYLFSGCTSLLTGVFPLLTSQNQSFRSSPFHTIDLGSVLSIGNYAFSSSSNLDTFIFRAGQIYPLGNVGGLSGTPFASGGRGGTIYIPKSLYDHLGDGTSLDYKAASNWATVDGYGTITWAKIEDSYYETHYADGTAISS